MIISFRCRQIEKLFSREAIPAQWREISAVALRKLTYLHGAKKLEDLRIPPSNCLEKLKGDRKHQYSIRINKKWRLCFEFANGSTSGVEIVDYH